MLVESAIANIVDTDAIPPGGAIDWLDLTWLECHRRFARKRTRAGHEIRLLLALGKTLKHGDLLGQLPDGSAVVVNLLLADVLVIVPNTSTEGISIAFQIGNLHVPMEMTSQHVLVPDTSETQAMLLKYDFKFASQHRLFQPTHWPDAVQLSADFQLIKRRSKSGSVEPAEPVIANSGRRHD